MNKSISIIIMIFILVIALLVGFILINKTGYSISYEKCQETNDDDCWHSLAHQTFNQSFCYKIKSNEIMEDCLKHS